MELHQTCESLSQGCFHPPGQGSTFLRDAVKPRPSMKTVPFQLPDLYRKLIALQSFHFEAQALYSFTLVFREGIWVPHEPDNSSSFIPTRLEARLVVGVGDRISIELTKVFAVTSYVLRR